MKILMLAMSMGLGGAETHVLELSRELVRRGHTVFAASRGGVLACKLEAGGVRHISVPLHSKNPACVAKSLAVLARLMEEERFDIVHAHARIPAVVASLLKRRFGFVFVTTAHGAYEAHSAMARIMDWGEHIFAVSEDIAENISKKYAYPSDKITLVPNGIDTARFCPDISGEAVRTRLSLTGKKVVMYLGRLAEDSYVPAKRLLECSKEIFSACDDVKAVLVGEGAKKAELSALAARVNRALGTETVLLPGAATEAEAYIAACDVFVGPSRSAIEALACGKPTVVAGNAGMLGLFSPETAEAARRTNFCCRGAAPTTAEGVKNAVLHALSLSECERKAAAEYGRNYICENYSVRKMADIYEAGYGRMLAKRGKNILLCGYYGYANAGDEAMLAVLVRALRASGANVRIMSVKGCEKSGEVARFNPSCVQKALAWADVLVFGGGNILQDKSSFLSLLYYAAVARAARAHGCKIAFAANGLGPFSCRISTLLAKKTLASADYISMREERSRALAEALTGRQVSLCADLVFAGKNAEKVLFSGEKYYAVFPKEVGKREEAELLRFFCAVKQRYGLVPVFAALHGKEDEWICRKFAARLPWARFPGACRAFRARALAKGAMFTLSMRLHGAVFSVAEGCPVIAAEGDGKTGAFFQSAGVEEHTRLCKISARELLRAADELISSREKNSAALKNAAEREKEKAEAEIERLRLFLSL
ncbi:MAG: glycosyltransferase [Clostridia bacterium]|nr:glycosyltransferase [Clostridia bacterium]